MEVICILVMYGAETVALHKSSNGWFQHSVGEKSSQRWMGKHKSVAGKKSAARESVS